MGKLALPPGFRFHPTDEELVSYYLRRKIYGRKLEFEAIGDLDLYKFEPWDLPELARLQTKDLEWYFFCPRDKKYPNGSRTNRATENGYWKATGKDRAVSSRSANVGMKKTLVYYKGRAPKGERTNWVMHEYRLENSECERGEAFQNCFVLCRIYQKSGAGPKNGEQYGAPVEEEEWETAPTGETEDVSGFGATLEAFRVQDILPSGVVSGEKLSKATKQVSTKGNANGPAVIKAEPQDFKVCEHEEMQFINLPAEMLAELREPVLMKKHVMVKAEILNEEPSTDLLAMFLSLPDDGEEEIVEEIQGLVDASNECNYQVGPRGGAQPEEAHVGFNEKDGNLPRDGDFFELNDLSPLLDSDEMLEQRSGKQEIWPTSGYNDGCSMREFANAGNLRRISEDVQVRPPLTSWSLDSYGQPGGESTMGLYGAVSGSCSIGGDELEYKDIPDLFKNFNALAAGERESCNSEFDEDRLLTDRLQNEGLMVSQAGSEERDEQYLDTRSSFSDMVDMNLVNVGLSCFDTTDDEALLWKPWPGKREGSVPVPLDNSTKARASCIDMATRNNCAGAEMSLNHQGLHSDKADKHSEAAKGSDGRGTPSKAFGVILHCLESIPILPASAADMSGTPLGSISVLASSLDIRAVAINCSCVNKDGAASSCMTCSFEKRGTFVRSLSYTGGKMVVEGSSTSLLALGIMGAIWAFFWFLLLGGSWKLLGGAFRLIFSE